MDERTQEILGAVDHLFTVHDAWEADDEVQHPTLALEQAIENAIEICDTGDVPGQCRELVDCMSRLGLEWDKYKNGQRTPNYLPIGSFWGAYRSVVQAREHARPADIKQPEPVYLLLQQKVSERQIAFFIWGWRNPRTGRFEGPFVTAAQQPDVAKIHAEAKEPGKYTKDWIHPEQIERQRERRIDLGRRLGAVERAEAADQPTEEKATVLELLREGQFPDVIARVKRISMDEVLQVAKANDITVNVRPNLASLRAPQEPGIFGEGDLADFGVDDDDGEEIEPPEPGSTVSEPTQPVEDLIRELGAAGKASPDIVAECRNQGHNVTYQQIKAVLKPAKAGK